MKLSRRKFVLLAGLGMPLGISSVREIDRPGRGPATPSTPAPEGREVPKQGTTESIKPRRLFAGATIGLVSPGGVISRESAVEEVERTLRSLDLQTVRGRHVLDRRGYLAGADEDRAADLHRMFANPDVDAVLALRGGWGSNRILPLLDYEFIRENPKILMGFSDVTSLLIALHARSGLVTFHGPVGISTWNDFTIDYVRRVLYDGEQVTMRNPRHVGPRGLIARDLVRTIRSGTARGTLIGGNLSVIVSMLGSPYLPDWNGHILFLEDTEEDIYRIDRMLTQLSLAGVLSQLSGIVFGKCTDCDADQPSLTLGQVLHDHFGPLECPSFYGSMIGHISDKFTVPLGVEAEIDAASGTIQLLEAAVT